MVLATACALAFPFWPNRLQLLDMGKLVGYGWESFLPWLFGILLWVVSLLVLLCWLHGKSWQQVRAVVLTTTTVVYAWFLAMYPTSAIDVYIYAARSRLFSTYGDNPNAVRPDVYWDVDPYMHFASGEWADDVSPYGPLWNILAYPVTLIGQDQIGVAILGFKVLCIIAILAMGWLVYRLVESSAPGWGLPAAMFLMWNPLVMWDGIGNAHNDIILLLPVIAALWCWSTGRHEWVIPCLVASVMIKYVTVILLPLAVVALWRRHPEWRERMYLALWSAGCSALLLAVALYPFYDVRAVIDSAEAQGNRVSLSPAWVVQATAAEWSLPIPTNDTIRLVAYSIMCLYIGGWMVACWRNPDRLGRAMFEVTFAFMLVASTNQRHWYVLWIVPLAAALIPGTPWKRTLLWSVTALFGHGCTIWLWYVYDIGANGYYGYAMLIVTIVFGPVILLSIWELANAAIGWLRPPPPATSSTAT